MFGGLLLLAGALFLLNNLGFLPAAAGDLFWPLLLVFAGLWILLRRSAGPAVLEREPVRVAVDGESAATLRIKHGAGRLTIGSSKEPAVLLEGTAAGGVQLSRRRNGSSTELELSVPSDRLLDLPFAWGSGFEWDLRLTPEVDWTLVLETGAGETRLALTELAVRNLLLKTGASSTEVDLPAVAGQAKVRVESGVSSVVLRVPASTAARIQVQSGLADIQVDGSRFPQTAGVYQSADYETASSRIDIDIQTGVGSVKVS